MMPNARASTVTTIPFKNNGHAADSDDPLDLAPHSEDAEVAALGATLMYPESLYETASILSPDDFFIVRHGWIWESLLILHQRGAAIDITTLAEDLKARDRLSEIGGRAYIAYLLNGTPTALHAFAYCDLVRRAAIRRRLLGAAGDIAQLAHDEEQDVIAALDQAQARIMAIQSETSIYIRNQVTALEAASSFFDTLEAWRDGRAQQGIQTPFTDLNGLTGGLLQKDLIIVAGRPSMGKSQLLLQFALQAVQDGHPVGIFSLEMTKEQIMARLFANVAGVSTHVSKRSALSDADWAKLVDAAGVISELPIYLDESRGLTAFQIRDRARRWKQRYGIELVMVDYLQLLAGVDGGREETRNHELDMATRILRDTGGELDVPMVVASQLSRAAEGKRPTLATLRDSGGIEQNADVVMFLYRDKPKDESGALPKCVLTDLIIEKQRNGPTGIIGLNWYGEITMFRDLAHPWQERQMDLANI